MGQKYKLFRTYEFQRQDVVGTYETSVERLPVSVAFTTQVSQTWEQKRGTYEEKFPLIPPLSLCEVKMSISRLKRLWTGKML